MQVTLTNDQYWEQLDSYAHSAFRFEQQPAYAVDYERDLFDSFVAGSPEPPDTRQEFRAWYAKIAQRAARGITLERVRIFDDPPTDYQRWTRYMDRWNIEAGEVIHYLPRQRADEVGLIDAFDGRDWWLFDNERLMTMAYNDEGRRTHTELTTEEDAVQRARELRHLAVRTARGEQT